MVLTSILHVSVDCIGYCSCGSVWTAVLFGWLFTLCHFFVSVDCRVPYSIWTILQSKLHHLQWGAANTISNDTSGGGPGLSKLLSKLVVGQNIVLLAVHAA